GLPLSTRPRITLDSRPCFRLYSRQDSNLVVRSNSAHTEECHANRPNVTVMTLRSGSGGPRSGAFNSSAVGRLDNMNRVFASLLLNQYRFRATWMFAPIMVALILRPASGQEPLLWGGLKPGPFAVGYRSLYRLDHTRQYDPDLVTDSMKLPAHKPRPIRIC